MFLRTHDTRSALVLKKFIDAYSKVVDSHYTGGVGVVLFDLVKEGFEIQMVDEIAQLIF